MHASTKFSFIDASIFVLINERPASKWNDIILLKQQKLSVYTDHSLMVTIIQTYACQHKTTACAGWVAHKDIVHAIQTIRLLQQ